MKASNIIGMEVINLYEGQVDGYVKNLVFTKDFKKIKGVNVYSDKTDKQYYLSVKQIFKLNDVVFIKNSSAINEEELQKDNSPINLPAYSSEGKNLGIITDAELDEKFNCVNFITSNTTINNNIAKITNSLVVFNTEKTIINTTIM